MYRGPPSAGLALPRDTSARQANRDMSGLDNLSSLARANSEADLQLRLRSPDLWRRLELHRLAVVSSSTSREAEKARKLALGLLKDVEPRLLFVAVDFCYGPAGDEAKQRAVDVALTSVLGSSVGPELLQEVHSSSRRFFPPPAVQLYMLWVGRRNNQRR